MSDKPTATTTSADANDGPLYVHVKCPDCTALEAKLAAAEAKIEHITHHGGMCPFCGAASGHKEDCCAMAPCEACAARRRSEQR